MAFLTIEPAPGLSADELQRAATNGPPEVTLASSHEQMLADAGFTSVESVDVTAEFSRTQQAWTDTWREHEVELVDLLGPDLVDERRADRQAMRSAIDQGLLRRTLYVTRRSANPARS